MVRTFVIGDIHGAHRALLQCLERASFNYETDSLISLGDVADGWPETRQCIDELLKIRNLTYVFGNHDFWTLEWMETGIVEPVWFEQGGKATMKSYADKIPATHIRFLKQALSYYLLDRNKLFVHAGINPEFRLEGQSLQTLLWDRSLAHTAYDRYSKGIPGSSPRYDEVYIGHTPIIPYVKPIQSGDIWLMDTGAGWSGVLSIMDIETKKFLPAILCPTLYPGIEGRKRK
jgi:serine/threonine protein phosphatase 1